MPVDNGRRSTRGFGSEGVPGQPPADGRCRGRDAAADGHFAGQVRAAPPRQRHPGLSWQRAGQRDDFGPVRGAEHRRAPAARSILQPGQPAGSEPAAPLADRVGAHPHLGGDRGVVLVGRRGEHDRGSQPVAVGPAHRLGPGRQHGLLFAGQDNLVWAWHGHAFLCRIRFIGSAPVPGTRQPRWRKPPGEDNCRGPIPRLHQGLPPGTAAARPGPRTLAADRQPADPPPRGLQLRRRHFDRRHHAQTVPAALCRLRQPMAVRDLPRQPRRLRPNRSSSPACPSAAAKTPPTPPVASTSTTPPPGPEPPTNLWARPHSGAAPHPNRHASAWLRLRSGAGAWLRLRERAPAAGQR